MGKRARILVLLSYYLPGYKAGGPIRTLVNVTERLGEEFDFYVLTADRDLGDRQPYLDIVRDAWIQVGKAKVRYLSSSQLTIRFLWKILRAFDYDVVYLNSCFSVLTRRLLLLRWLGLLPRKPVILAPRGELNPGALKIKTLKKRLYLGCAKFMHLYKGVLWQASSGYEKEDILQVFGSRLDSDSVHVAPNLPADAPLNPHVMPSLPKRPDHARIIFLSRIARKKNLKFALSCLQQVSGTVTFDIYGPIEDEAYWQACQTVTKSLPGNVKVSYKGVVSPKQVDDVFGRYHLFLFPTWGENFGHVIFESLRAGCPVLISDQTPWRDLTEHTAGWAVPLSEPEQFQRRLNRLVAMHDADFRDWSRGAQEYAATFAGNPSLVKANRALFLKALAR